MKSASSTRTLLYTTYDAHLAAALCTYADEQPAFGRQLHALLHDTWHGGVSTPHYVPVYIPALLPSDDEAAFNRARWLLGSIADPQHSTHEVESVLSSWYRHQEREEPRSLVLGLKYGIVDYGVIGHPRRKYEPMDIIVHDDAAASTPAVQLSRVVATLSHRVVEQGLISAGGHTGRLEPVLGDWLFGEKEIVLHAAPRVALRSIEQAVTSLKAPCGILRDERGVAAVALTPTLDLTDLPGSPDTRAL